MIIKNFKKTIFKAVKEIYLFPNKFLLDRDNLNYKLISENWVKNISDIMRNEIEINKSDILLYLKESKKDLIYNVNIEKTLSKKLQDQVLSAFTSKEVIDIVSKFQGNRVKFSNFTVKANFYNQNCPEEYGPRMWHRDNDSFFGQTKLFLVLNDINEHTGGLFYFIPQNKIDEFTKFKSSYKENDQYNKKDWNKRIKNMDIVETLKLKNSIIEYGKNKNEALLIDTNETYHKGGYIKKENSIRYLLQVVFEPRFFSISQWNSLYSRNRLYKYLKIYLTKFKEILRNEIKL